MADIRLNLPVHSHSTLTGDTESVLVVRVPGNSVRQTWRLEKECQIKDKLIFGRVNDDAAIIEKLYWKRKNNNS